MGTRADFYIRKEDQMQWLGSIAWDGYVSGIDQKVLTSQNEEDFKFNLNNFFSSRSDVTLPSDGWPWPWGNSKLTDCCYVYESGRVMRMYDHDGNYDDHKTECLFVRALAKTYDNEKDEDIEPSETWSFRVPDMKSIQNIATGNKKSGMLIISATNSGITTN